jgi:hypothetical protein
MTPLSQSSNNLGILKASLIIRRLVLQYLYDHRAEIEVVVQAGDTAARNAALDTLLANIGAALAADRTLGGLCDWVEPEAPRPVDLPIEGAAALKAAIVPVVLTYATTDPLG